MSLTIARETLNASNVSLVVVSGGGEVVFVSRKSGIISLASESPPLSGAFAADKVIGLAAAAFLIDGGALGVYGKVMTHAAQALLAARGVMAEYGKLVPFVKNRSGDGRCPIDSLCDGKTDIADIIVSVRHFLNQNNTRSVLCFSSKLRRKC